MNKLARPKRSGLEYFPLDVSAGNDDEIELLESEYGLDGFAIYIKLLQMIYRNGYYCPWNKKEQLIFSKKAHIEIERVLEIIDSCLEWGLFDKKMLKDYNILTSHGIQQRYISAFGRRSALEMYKEYVLLTQSEVNATKTLVIVTLMQQNVAETPQSKAKESKGKETKEEKKKAEESINDATANISRALERGFGRLASMLEVETLCSYLEEGIKVELIERAIEEAVCNSAPNLKYVKAILTRCIQNKIYTVESYNLSQEERKKKVKGNGANNTGPNTEDSEPVEDEFAKYAEQHGIQ